MINGLGGDFLDWFCFGFCLRIITPEKKSNNHPLWLVGILQVASATIRFHSLKDFTYARYGRHPALVFTMISFYCSHVYLVEVHVCWCCYSKIM